MAFYSVRVDEEGREIDSTRLTFETRRIDRCQSYERRQGYEGFEIKRIPTPVRCVNSAIFIEKGNDMIVNSFRGEDSSEIESEGTTDDGKSKNAVPSIELNSNESFPSTTNLTYSYRKVCRVTKLIQKPNAYDEWLKAKTLASRYEKERIRRENIERQQREIEEKAKRRQKSQKQFQGWIAAKSNPKKSNTPNPKPITVNGSNSATTMKDELLIKQERDLANFQAWLKRKNRDERILKEKKLAELQQKEEERDRKIKLAQLEYSMWLKTRASKVPKPVPLNQGLLSLKGSTSEPYINPIPWVNIIQTEQE